MVQLAGLSERLVVGLVACLGMLATVRVSAQEVSDSPRRSIENVRGDLYRVQDGRRATVFLLTPAGIILGDPLSTPTARWLKAELANRFPERPVRYVARTQHEFDRAAGVDVFDIDTGRVAQDRFNGELSESRSRLSRKLRPLDRNKNAVLEGWEVSNSTSPNDLLALDRDHDGALAPEELYQDVVLAVEGFRWRYTISLGGKSVILVHTPMQDAPELTALYFPAERVLFVSDYPRASPFNADEMIPWVRAVSPLDVDVVIAGRDDADTSQLIAETRYFAEMLSGVASGLKQRRSLERLQGDLPLDTYRNTGAYPGRASQIAGFHKSLHLLTASIRAAPLVNRVNVDPACGSYTVRCEVTSNTAPAGTVGASVSFERFTVMTEVTTGVRITADKRSQYDDQAYEYSDREVSFLVGYGVLEGSPLTLGLSFGQSWVRGRTRGTRALRDIFGPLPDPFAAYEFSQKGSGVAMGIDPGVSLPGRFSAVFPLRFTRVSQVGLDRQAWRFRAGVGLAFTFIRRVF